MTKWVILVDPDINFLKTVGQVLSKNHIRVTALKTGEALLNYLKENDAPDLIMIDSDIKSFTVEDNIKELREKETLKGVPSIPVMVFTNDTSRNFEIIARQKGIAGFIRKPCEADEVTRKVKQVLGIEEKEKSFQEELIAEESASIIEDTILSLSRYSNILREKEISNQALFLEKKEFIHVYHFIMRYIKRYSKLLL